MALASIENSILLALSAAYKFKYPVLATNAPYTLFPFFIYISDAFNTEADSKTTDIFVVEKLVGIKFEAYNELALIVVPFIVVPFTIVPFKFDTERLLV